MTPGECLHVEGHRLVFIEHPLCAESHSDEPVWWDEGERCAQCARARVPETGEAVLLWFVGRIHWSVHRDEPRYDYFKRLLSPTNNANYEQRQQAA